MTKITPTLGRIVWYTPHPDAGLKEQQAAQIARVNDDGTLNLMVVAPDGYPYGVQNVALAQEGDDKPTNASYAEWMPYQVGQAAKDADTAGNGPSTSTADSSNGTPASDSTTTTEVETKAYADGTTATGVAPLPDESPIADQKLSDESLIERAEHGIEHVGEVVKEDFEHLTGLGNNE